MTICEYMNLVDKAETALDYDACLLHNTFVQLKDITDVLVNDNEHGVKRALTELSDIRWKINDWLEDCNHNSLVKAIKNATNEIETEYENKQLKATQGA